MNEELKTPEPKRKWLLVGIPLCLAMGLLQFDRALGGNSRSWMYVIEWPFFGLFLFYMYWKLQQPQEPYDDSQDPPREVN